MKSILLLVCGILAAWSVNAQNFVSTTASNRNIVLEEFTGIRCTFCPDGHKKAQDLSDQNPGRVVLVNIHVGSFAAPSSGQPDFRTVFGTAIDNQATVTGYPAGTINRRPFPNTGPNANPSATGQGACATCTAMSRGYWATVGATILGEASPVNVAAQADIDYGSRALNVITETYYTANGPTATNKLSVVLLQDNVPGPQTGATYNPSSILPNGDYNHKHMLRHMPAGQWGLTIPTTTASTFQADTVTYTIPNDYLGIAANLADMHVAVFVAEGQQTILTGANAAMTYTTPPGTSIADMTMAAAGTAPNSYCSNAYTPSVTVSNTSNQAIDSFEVSYTLNTGTPMTQLITTPLAAGANTTVNFTAITLAGGSNSISYNYDFATYNSALVDVTSSNNSIVGGPYLILNNLAATTTSISTIFDGLAIGTDAPANAIADNPDDIRAYAVDGGISTAVTWNLGGFGLSDGCYRWDFYAIDNGLSSKIVYEKMNLSGVNAADTLALTWSHAYAQYSTSNDMLNVKISTDCGATWTTLWSQAGATLATAPVNSSSRFYPQVTEWRANSVDLSAYAGQGEVMIAFEGVSNYGNSLYVDDINTELKVYNSVSSVQNPTTKFEVYPNPVRNSMTVDFSVEEQTDLNISVVNTLGQTVKQIASNDFVGNTTLTVNTSDLASGVYFITAKSTNGIVTKRFVVEK